MQALEIGHLGGIARLDQRLEPHADQLHQAAAEHRLLAEEIGLAFLAEIRLDDPRTPAADGRAIAEPDLERLARGIGIDGHEAGHAAALDELAPHGVAGALGGHHDDVHALFRLDQAEMDVEAMGKGDGCTGADVVMDVFAIGLGLQLVGHGEHDQVAPGRRLGNVHHGQPLGLGLLRGFRSFAQRHDDVLRPRIAQVEGMGMALAAIAENGNLLVLDQVDVAVTIVIDAHGGLLPGWLMDGD